MAWHSTAVDYQNFDHRLDRGTLEAGWQILVKDGGDHHIRSYITAKEDLSMKALVDGKVIAESDDIVECDGYQYFPRSAVRMDWLEKAQKTESDRACPHGVQFYGVVVDDVRHQRAAWSYESPRPQMKQVSHRFGFWEDVEVG